MAKIEDCLNDNELNMIFRLGILANVFQSLDFFMDLKEVSNDQLMKALEIQNQTYLKEILEGQKAILEELSYLREKVEMFDKSNKI